MRTTIASKILGTALGLFALMALASTLSFVMANQVGSHVDRLSSDYIPAYGNLARANARSLEQALALRRLLLAAAVPSPDPNAVAAERAAFDQKGADFITELNKARDRINKEIDSGSAFADPLELARIDVRIAGMIDDDQRHYTDEVDRLLKSIAAGNVGAVTGETRRIEALRDEMDQWLDDVRTDLFRVVHDAAKITRDSQTRVTIIGAVLTALAAALGLVVATIISSGLARPLRRLLEGTKAVEAGRLESTCSWRRATQSVG